MPEQLILIRQPGLREISKEDVRTALDDRQLWLEHEWVDVDMRPFAADVAAGAWEAVDRFLRERAAAVHKLADAMSDPEIHYFGLAEVPQTIALGAYIGLERKVVVHDFDRDSGGWRWPSEGPSLKTAPASVPDQVIPQRGIVPLLVNISYPVSEADIAAVIGDETFPPVRVDLLGDGSGLGRVRSANDLAIVRAAIREALARLRKAYPNAEVIHLFAPVPTSVAFALGQELVPRNTPPVQTYRYRAEGEPKQQAAILVRDVAEPESGPALTEAERTAAVSLRRDVWGEELEAVRAQATSLGERATSGLWYEGFAQRDAFVQATPFPRLARLADLVPPKSQVATEAYALPRDYRYADLTWRISDELTLNLGAGCGDEAGHRRRIRLFLLHEQLHHHHMITADTAAEVGKFPNALEHVDYTADFYALCHELDRAMTRGEVDQDDEFTVVQWICAGVEEIVQSFWAFESAHPRIWEIRRLRRHLNWYWQLARLGGVRTVEDALRTLARKPVVEIAGLHTRASGRRVEVDLERFLPQTELEVAVILDDESLDRRAGGGGTDPRVLCQAMVARDHEAVKSYFRALERYARVRHPR